MNIMGLPCRCSLRLSVLSFWSRVTMVGSIFAASIVVVLAGVLINCELWLLQRR